MLDVRLGHGLPSRPHEPQTETAKLDPGNPRSTV